MPKIIPEPELTAIEAFLRNQPQGTGIAEIAAVFPALPRRTLQHRLKTLVDATRLVKIGQGRWVKYRPGPIKGEAGLVEEPDTLDAYGERYVPVSTAGSEIRDYVRQPKLNRKPVAYDRRFLDAYRPNADAYLSQAERQKLASIAAETLQPYAMAAEPAGTFARQIFNRLLIDLAWNSSRLEGNTYSLLDTKRLIEFGQAASARHLDTQMILNHKDAIEFLLSAPDEIAFNRRTLLNLHALLSNNLLLDEFAAGRLRRIVVGIGGSVFHPPEIPQVIEECFDQLLLTAAAIADPFEQALFVMVQLPYLQPFEDVNKRVSRLAANIPFIKNNLPPLSFVEVPERAYKDAVLGVYELNRIDLLKDIFIWAYERSAARYAAVRQTIGEPDPFRLRFRDELQRIVRDIVMNNLGRPQAIARLRLWTAQHIPLADREKFEESAENELLALHEGNYARYRLRPAEFGAWRRIWEESKP